MKKDNTNTNTERAIGFFLASSGRSFKSPEEDKLPINPALSRTPFKGGYGDADAVMKGEICDDAKVSGLQKPPAVLFAPLRGEGGDLVAYLL